MKTRLRLVSISVESDDPADIAHALTWMKDALKTAEREAYLDIGKPVKIKPVRRKRPITNKP